MDSSWCPRFPSGFTCLLCMMLLTTASFALLQGLLVLFCVQSLNFSDQQAYLLYAAFTSLSFAIPVLGGYIGGRYVGYTNCIIFGLLLSVTGFYLICFTDISYLYFGLAAIVVGSACCLPNLYVLVGQLLQPHLPQRDAGFTLSYTFMNVGAFLALSASGFLVRIWSYQSAFIIAAIIDIAALFCVLLNSRRFSLLERQDGSKRHSGYRCILGVWMLIIAIPITAQLLFMAEYSDKVLWFMAGIAFLFTLYLMHRACGKQVQQYQAFLVIVLLGIAFWALYALEPSVLTIFIKRNVDRHLFHTLIPAADFFSLNPLFIIALGSALSVILLLLHKHKIIFSLPYKFTLGIVLMGLAYLILSSSIYFHGSQGLISIGWVIGAYFFLAAGELLISPTGAALVGLIAPTRFEGTIMGTWLLSTGIGGSIAGYLSELTLRPHSNALPSATNPIYAHSFALFGGIALCIAAIAAFLSPFLLKRLQR